MTPQCCPSVLSLHAEDERHLDELPDVACLYQCGGEALGSKMTREAPHLAVTVAPASATGELVGLAGALTINMVDRKHCYV